MERRHNYPELRSINALLTHSTVVTDTWLRAGSSFRRLLFTQFFYLTACHFNLKYAESYNVDFKM
jgi:hypothetical protein